MNSSENRIIEKQQRNSHFNDRNEELIFIYKNSESKEERNYVLAELVKNNERLILKTAYRYEANVHGGSISLEDLLQEGRCGLIYAADKYELSSPASFGTYASYYIRNRIVRFIENTDRIIRIPVGLQEKMRIVTNAENQLRYSEGKVPSPGDIAEQLRITESQLDKILLAMPYPSSLNVPLENGIDLEQECMLPAVTNNIDDWIGNLEYTELMRDLKICLTHKEFDVLCRRAAVGVYDVPQTLGQIADIYDVSVTSIARFEKRGRKKALRVLKRRGYDIGQRAIY